MRLFANSLDGLPLDAGWRPKPLPLLRPEDLTAGQTALLLALGRERIVVLKAAYGMRSRMRFAASRGIVEDLPVVELIAMGLAEHFTARAGPPAERSTIRLSREGRRLRALIWRQL